MWLQLTSRRRLQFRAIGRMFNYLKPRAAGGRFSPLADLPGNSACGGLRKRQDRIAESIDTRFSSPFPGGPRAERANAGHCQPAIGQRHSDGGGLWNSAERDANRKAADSDRRPAPPQG